MTREQTRLNKMIKAEKKEEKKKLQKDQPKKALRKERERSHLPPQQYPHRPQLQSKNHQRTTKLGPFWDHQDFPRKHL